MLRSITAKQFQEWYLYAQIEPFGEKRADLRMAATNALLANINRGKNQTPYKIEDFLFNFEPKPKETWEEKARLAAIWARVYAK